MLQRKGCGFRSLPWKNSRRKSKLCSWTPQLTQPRFPRCSHLISSERACILFSPMVENLEGLMTASWRHGSIGQRPPLFISGQSADAHTVFSMMKSTQAQRVCLPWRRALSWKWCAASCPLGNDILLNPVSYVRLFVTGSLLWAVAYLSRLLHVWGFSSKNTGMVVPPSQESYLT